VGSLIAQPTAAMIWLKKSNINGIADLRGKTIAIPGLPFQKSLLRNVLARAGVSLKDVKVESVGYKLVPALVNGRADAIFGGSWNLDGVKLESLGLKPVITRVEDLGVPAYEELVVITRADRAAKEPKLVRDFMWAVKRGTAAAIKDPEAAVDVIEEGDEKDPEADRKVTEAEAEATFPLLSRSGHMSTDRAKHLVDWVYEQGIIQRRLPVSTLLADGRR
jgi:putative hydroxymethylpyrimidine transport system substrate-binding protein